MRIRPARRVALIALMVAACASPTPPVAPAPLTSPSASDRATPRASSSVARAPASPSPSPSASREPVSLLPRRRPIAPPGSILAVVPFVAHDADAIPDLEIVALRSNGLRQPIAVIPNVGADIPGGQLQLADEPLVVTPEGYIALVFELPITGAGPEPVVIRVYDVRDPAAPPVLEIEGVCVGPYTWGPGSLLGVQQYERSRNGCRDRPARDIYDVPRGTRRTVRYEAGIELGESWTKDGDAWSAQRGDAVGLVSIYNGRFTPLPRPAPRIYWREGAPRPASVDDLVIAAADVDPAPPFAQVRIYDPAEPAAGATVWLDSRQVRWYDLQWDVDGRGLLVLVEDDDALTVRRLDAPNKARDLGRIELPGGIPAARERLEPIGIFPGAKRGELVVVFRLRVGREVRLYRYSTLDRRLLVVASSTHMVHFAGFIPPLPCCY